MEDSLAERFLKDKRTFWLTGAWICILFLTSNLPWQLDNYDQAKPAFTSFEMVHEGHWLYPRMPLDPVAQKPPFLAWVSSFCYAITRWWDLAWRLPSLLSALAISILLLRAASLAYGRTAGLISLGAFGFNLLSARLATLVATDMLLALSIFLAGLLIWQKIRSGNAWNSRDRWRFFGLLTLSLFIKGPVVYAFLLLGIAAFAWWKRSDKVMSAWAGAWPWLGSLAVFLAWVAGGIVFKPGFYDEVIMREFLGRFSKTIQEPQPVYFYLPHLVYRFTPWGFLMILLAIVCRTRGRVREALHRMPADIFWLICWSLSGLIVMSLVPSKRVDRIFPVIPPLCLLLGAQVGMGLTAQESRRRVYQWSAAALIFAFLFTAGYNLWRVVPGYLYQRDALVTFSRTVRQQAARYHWRYEVVLSENANGTEGMLLYLQKPHFLPLDKAVEEWNSGKIEALVVPEDRMSLAMAELRDATIAPLRTSKREDPHAPSYFLITRSRNI